MIFLRSTFADYAKEKEFNDFLSTLRPYGVTYLSHTVREPNGDAVLFYSDMDWGTYFIGGKYYDKDAIVKHACKTNTFVIPWSSVAMDSEQRKIYQDREEKFRKYNGITISFRDGARHHLIGLATDTKSYELSKFCLQTPQVMLDCLTFVRNAYK